ncbi:MAG: phosphate ABC transporter permease subunit PstC [Leptospiraceae bacterium]|nr:phosphate ABC transporter permease subunit PstC [Leptospiraceae bacterium]MDW7975122.1 phosphate ABC transporter permease subunit PstC [Leptospiraceae bacterium]
METLQQEQKRILTRAITESRENVFSRYGKTPSFSLTERLLKYTLTFFGWLTVVITLLIAYILIQDGVLFFSKVSPVDYFFGREWAPFGQPKKFGVLPLVNGTLMIAIGSIVIAAPLGLLTAVFLTQYATRQVREVTIPLIEILGGIPTVVYGYFALDVITPLLKKVFPEIEIFNALSATIVVGISLIPLVASLSADSIRAVPKSIQMGGYALGLTKFHVVTRIIVPAAFSGIVASVILAFARAIGETMAVTLAAGASPKLTLNYLESIQTMTAFIVQISLGDTPYGSIEYYTIYAVGLHLFLITLAFNWLALQLVRKYREVYR